MLSPGGRILRAAGSRRVRITGALVVGLVVVLAAILAYRLPPPSGQGPTLDSPEVHLTCETGDPDRPCAFTPREITVRLDATVRWVNDEAVFHTITSTDTLDVLRPNGLFDGRLFEREAVFEYGFVHPGPHHYYCQVHAESMVGTVNVLE
jgi:plastocyanin